MVYPVGNHITVDMPKQSIRMSFNKPVSVSVDTPASTMKDDLPPTACAATLRSRFTVTASLALILTFVLVALAVSIPIYLLWPSSSGGAPSDHSLLDPIFSNGAVLQRAPVASRVWGHATPGSHVTVTLLQTLMTVNASEHDGSWLLELPPFEAQAAVTLSVSSLEERVDVSVDFGDVFLCSGQSNMWWPRAMTGSDSTDPAPPGLAPVRAYHRMFGWGAPDEQFSAVCWHAALEIAARDNVTVGLLAESHGGTSITCWSAPEDLETCSFHDDEHPSECYNDKIMPLAPFALRGFLWYADATRTRHQHWHQSAS